MWNCLHERQSQNRQEDQIEFDDQFLVYHRAGPGIAFGPRNCNIFGLHRAGRKRIYEKAKQLQRISSDLPEVFRWLGQRSAWLSY
jgi:hypothetical protein